MSDDDAVLRDLCRQSSALSKALSKSVGRARRVARRGNIPVTLLADIQAAETLIARLERVETDVEADSDE